MPEYKPDVFTSNKIGERVTFYTDLDSISFVVESIAVHDFIILLNGTDSAYTQIRYEPSYLDNLKRLGIMEQKLKSSFRLLPIKMPLILI